MKGEAMEVRDASAGYALQVRMPVVPEGYKQTEVGVIPEDWGAVRLGDLFNFKNGLNKEKYFFGHGTPIVNYMDVFSRPGLHCRDIKGRVSLSREEINRFDVKEGDVFFTRTSETVDEIGTASVMLESAKDTVFSGFVLRARPMTSRVLDVFNQFCFQNQSVRRQIVASATYTTRALINGRALSQVLVPLPSEEEQRAIATALSDVDALLEALARLIAKKRDIKQATMQQLLTGQTRLPGFEGEWEVRSLGDVGMCLRGVSYKGGSDLSAFDTDSTKRLLRSNNIQDATVITTDIQYVNFERVSEKQLLRDCDILICMANGTKALVGKAGFFTVRDGYEYTFGAFMGCFRTDSINANAAFVFYLFQTEHYRNFINNLLAGSSINNLTPANLESLEFPMPPLREQTAIATVLSDMDAEIDALKVRRAKTAALKQAMMQELLTGRTRLVERTSEESLHG